MKIVYFIFFILMIGLNSCKKFKQNACQFTDCDSRRNTKLVAENWSGKMLYNNEINKWGIISLVTGNVQRRRISFICGPLNDSFKLADKPVLYSGNLKESCSNPNPSSVDEEIFYILPTLLR